MKRIDETTSEWDVALGTTRVVFGAGSLDLLGGLVRDLGAERPLLVTDPQVRAAGHLDRAAASLSRSGLEHRVFDGADENPTASVVGDGVSVAREFRADCLVGLGGGSSMDCAKAINFLFTNGGRMEDYWGHGKATKPMLPSIGVPTTAGTGSEAQSYTLISQDGTGVKMACGDEKARFATVLLDPRLAATAPRSVVAVTGIDAVAHAIESHVSTTSNPVSTMFSREAWRLLARNFERVLDGDADIAAWGNMQVAAYFAGMAIEHSMLGAAHACANPLTARFGVVHGQAVGVMLPHVMRFNASTVGASYGGLLESDSGRGATECLVERVENLLDSAGLARRLRDLSVPEGALPQLAEEAATQWTGGFNPVMVTNSELQKLYELAW